MNNKITIAVVILLTLGVFTWLVNYGWQNRYGSIDTYEVTESEVLSVSYHAEDLALKETDVFADSHCETNRRVGRILGFQQLDVTGLGKHLQNKRTKRAG